MRERQKKGIIGKRGRGKREGGAVGKIRLQANLIQIFLPVLASEESPVLLVRLCRTGR